MIVFMFMYYKTYMYWLIIRLKQWLYNFSSDERKCKAYISITNFLLFLPFIKNKFGVIPNSAAV